VRRWAYPALAFFTGATVTIFEFAAPSLFRAYFGQTVYVWANVIGVILGALAVGYALGGRWADGTTTLRPLAAVLAFAGAYGLVVAWLGPHVSLWLAGPDEYTQDTALPAFVAQSLAASLILFAPPLMALGMATPLMVQRASADWPVGRSAGLVFGVGTAGSIVGIYLTTFVFVDWIGVRATIAVAAGALALCGAWLFWKSGARRGAAGSAAVLILLPLGWSPPWADLPPDGAKLVVAFESPYQLVRVVDTPPQDDGSRQRWLAFDEGMGTYHSIEVGDAEWTGAYYDVFARIPEWLGDEGPWRICLIGNAAGTMSKLLHRHHDPKLLQLDGVEIDPAVTEAARTMDMRDYETTHPGLRVFHEDGRTFLRRAKPGTYDAIVMDAYARQVSIPAALATKEFFALCRSRLREGGMLLVNLGALRPGGRLVRVVCNTLHAGFQTPVYRCPLEYQSNVVLIAARGGPPRAPPDDLPLFASQSFGLHVPDGLVLTDDYCPVESLTANDLMLR